MDHLDIVRSCEEAFSRYGDTFQGAGWTKTEEQADRRYSVMLDLMAVQDGSYSLLDFGCGSARLLDYAIRAGRSGNVIYSGLDLAPCVIDHCRTKYADRIFYNLDVLAGSDELPTFDAVILNGVFHYKGEIPQGEMFDYFCALLRAVRPHARSALAFNVMSTHVEWTRDDLFHLPIEQATDFIASTLSRRFTVRQDYGLYEYTVYVYL
jgi:cyclopropane fatty-acyl-phospholipid synthase-like methyltransferase